jgi:RimJ/RimL family protein N-acetyltransferase
LWLCVPRLKLRSAGARCSSPSAGTFGIVLAMKPATATLHTDRLLLTPLDPADASEMVDVLSNEELYVFTGGKPPSLEELEGRYRAQAAGPGDRDELWHNWIIRLVDSPAAVGFVQATVITDSADLAWVVGHEWQGRGFAIEAATAMRSWLTANGVERFTAHVHPEHHVSGRVARAVGLEPTDEIDADGEVVWASRRPLDSPDAVP